MTGLDQNVTIRIYSPTKPIEIMGKAKVGRGAVSPETYALLMPRHAGNHPEIVNTWRPHQDTQEEWERR